LTSSYKKAAVIGHGSIGARHRRVLESFGLSVATVSRRVLPEISNCYESVEDCLRKWSPDYVVIANETSMHRSSFESLRAEKYSGRLLLEKPAFSQSMTGIDCRDAWVTYNLRFSPVLQRLKKELKNKKILTATSYCGQYLPDWRPGRPLNESYSSQKQLGGGVLRDLSHELDYNMWLFGKPIRCTADVQKLSALPIDSDDSCSILAVTASNIQLVIHINYLARIPTRLVTVCTEDQYFQADLVNQTLKVGNEIHTFEVDRDLTYREMHRSLLVKTSADESTATLEEGLHILRWIDCCEKSSLEKRWIEL
jgi:predicted dehydrogenase